MIFLTQGQPSHYFKAKFCFFSFVLFIYLFIYLFKCLKSMTNSDTNNMKFSSIYEPSQKNNSEHVHS